MNYNSRTALVASLLALAIGSGVSPSISYAQCPPAMVFDGEAAGDGFARSVSGAGDVDKDGYPDLIVGASGNDAGGIFAGRAYVYSGQTGALLHTFTGEAAGDQFGISVSGAGDVNNDGYADLIIGAWLSDVGGTDAGRAYIYSGQTGMLLHTFTGEAAGDQFGTSVSGAGDVDKDGFADLIVGAQTNNNPGGTQAGRAYVYSGQTGALMHTFDGEAAADLFGFSVSGAGDVNNDGFPDLIVGALFNDAAGTTAGRAYVFSGQFWTLLHTFTGEATGDQFGFSVSGAGDVDNDGFADLIVGARRNNAGGAAAGRAYVYSGQSGAPLHVFTGEAAGDIFGFSVSGAGDVDNDGFADLIVGARANSGGGALAGRAYVYSGQTAALLYTFDGEAAGDQFGIAVSGAGDVNNDGSDDVIVGGSLHDHGGNDAGRAYVYLLGDADGDGFDNACDNCPFIANNQADADGDGEGDDCDDCPVHDFIPPLPCTLAGDANNDGSVNIADVTFLIRRIFAGGCRPPSCAEADADGNGAVNIADITFLICRFFCPGGAAPVCGPPGMGC